jgi:hypothetical protein
VIGVDGGVIQAADGSLVMLAPGALLGDKAITITRLEESELARPVPRGFTLGAAYRLDLGGDALDIPAQLAFRAPAGVAAGTKAYFMRLTQIPDVDGTLKTIGSRPMPGSSTIRGSRGPVRRPITALMTASIPQCCSRASWAVSYWCGANSTST